MLPRLQGPPGIRPPEPSPRSVAEVLGPRHLAPDAVRWELHRVWVVEATVVPGKRHPVARRRIYLDEDSWLALLYDATGGMATGAPGTSPTRSPCSCRSCPAW